MAERETLARRAVNEANARGASVEEMIQLHHEIIHGMDPDEALRRVGGFEHVSEPVRRGENP